MQRIATGARPDLEDKAREAGFTFHHMHGEPYWDEETVYADVKATLVWVDSRTGRPTPLPYPSSSPAPDPSSEVGPAS